MSKRFFPQQHGDRKKAKLDITISDHNFPLSQNSGAAGANNDADNWGDDNDDEILLMASQACEQAYSNNSTLPDFSLCMHPAATSTQMFPQPSSSKTEFTFKKPTPNSMQVTSTQLKDKCNRISSPLPGMSSKIPNTPETMKYNEDLIYDKVYKGQDADHIYRQLLQLQEENVKLKSENGKLLDKCVTKEGEASILRTQLKSCQVAVDNARMEKIKAQEKIQMEWTDKLSVLSGQMHDLRTQLDFKNLEIISIKEKCKMLESTKVKLTQVTVPNSDISSSHRHHNNLSSTYNMSMSQRRVKMASVAAQTNSRAHILKLNKTHCSAPPKLTSILPLILEPTSEQPSLLDYNDKLRTDSDHSQHNCRVFSTFHRIPSTPAVIRHRIQSKVTINCIQEDVTCIADGVNVKEKLDKVLKATQAALSEVQRSLRTINTRATTAFHKQMDERYITSAGTYLQVPRRCLLSGRAIYKEEQAILARRMVAILAYILEHSRKIIPEDQVKGIMDSVKDGLLLVISDICTLLDTASCATLYSGLIYSITTFLQTLPPSQLSTAIVKTIIVCRPMFFALCGALAVLRRLAVVEGVPICAGGGNLRVDFEQGVLLYKKDSCHFHVLLKQIEVALKCIEKQNLTQEALTTTQNLLGFYSNYSKQSLEQPNNRCDCQLVLMQVIVYALRICAVMMTHCQSTADANRLLAVSRAGLGLLHLSAQRDAEFWAQLGAAEGPLIQLCDTLRSRTHDELHENMLLELSASYQCAAEDTTPSFHRQAWVKSFESFSLAD